ncbi:cytochrome b5-like [Diospyros lotus]|uniref:cytochrome b5-like n=1 Tax=Diospyros lotus TaxID=55363 RepID=UPI0022571160|nr:cytochrome b5-like [Diospyros lotus]
MGPEDRKVLSFAEVSLHSDMKDCWVIINGKAYDVTDFLLVHPGGQEILLMAAGKDASEEFENAGHGSAARLMLDEFYVGEVDPLSMPTTIVQTSPKQVLKYDKLSNVVFQLFRRFLPFSVLVVAIAIVRFFT